ncbi:hypothetical protein GCM10007276_10720 [Agaricicola taiwanensis]|uniref:asparagine synthase (glutamine-hydrolyzing) n=1 Tax=Agaricicola taiwanensis TaxID=591372 RepID=A0A8J2YGC5_9RHOB|nr:asparagine synthetase B family protein [Agaricicola taiwanensis]GGE35079.1 hypothetical protein GCM10007276_10720 [Agaricicola taiwanensis]
MEAAATQAFSHAVTLGPDWGWSSHRIGVAVAHVRGYVFDGSRTLSGEEAARHAVPAILAAPDDAALIEVLKRLSGHFALVVELPQRIIATVDRIRSIPLMFGAKDGSIYIDDRGQRLRERLGLAASDIAPEQALACAMSGYAVGAQTLYRGLQQLRAGEALCLDAGGARTLRWFIYDAWNTDDVSEPEKRLSELHRFLMERLAASAAGRTIAVPLSAGYDSRFIASGLKAVGYSHVRLFSYGRPGNHEALTAKAIAERLDYPWTFIPFTTASQKAMFADPSHEVALWQLGDTCGGIPFEQDWTAIKHLKDHKVVPADALIVNGQSGDFITGNHVLAPSVNETTPQRALEAYVKKHYRLWRHLAAGSNEAVIKSLLDAEIKGAGADLDRDALHGVFEMLEYQDRQAKYVVSGQRTYEAFGFQWRLPLWDDDYVQFWRRMPLKHKLRQNLYRRVLEQDNWGGVWSGIPVNAKTITPSWIRPLRLMAKAGAAPFGRDHWHDTERRLFGWWMDPLRTSAVVPYSRAVRETRGPRHAVSFIAERYLAQHGLSLEALA